MADQSKETLVLSRDDVEGLLDLETAMEVTRDAFREQARGQAAQQPPMHIDLADGGALRTVSGALLGSQRTGVRVTGALKLASPSGAAMLFDSRTADLLSVLAYPHGTTRTAAVMGVATDVLAAEDAHRITLIGTGRNAMGLLEAAAIARPISSIRVYGRNKDRLSAFVETANGILDSQVTGTHELAEALDSTDIVFVSTDSTTPVLSLADVPENCLVAGMGVPSEFNDDLYLEAEVVVVSSKDHERGFDDVWHGAISSALVDLDSSGRLPWSSVIELADLIDDAAPPRTGVRVFRESAGGYGDIALASYVYERALESGRGQRVRFA